MITKDVLARLTAALSVAAVVLGAPQLLGAALRFVQ